MQKDNVLVSSGQKWSFNQEVADCFDDMLQRSIPGYDTMRELVTNIGSEFVKDSFNIIDLGCGNGEGIAPFVHYFGTMQDYYLVDESEPMLDICRERYEELIRYGMLNVKNMDIRHEFPNVRAGLILSVLTLQFVPIEYRPAILKRVYDHLKPGGAFILVEKVTCESAELQNHIANEYYKLKQKNGYSKIQIENKRESLEGVMTCLPASWNEDMLRNAGFTKIENFWRHLNFSGWVAIK